MNVQHSNLNFGLGETADLLRSSVHEFASQEIAPLAAEIDQSNEFPSHLWQALGDMGLLGITVSEQFGGTGMGYLEHVVAMEEISRSSRFSRSVLRRSLESCRQPDFLQRHRPTKTQILAQTHQR